MTTGSFICGCKTTALSAGERAFFRDANPWGLILFARNVENRDQLKRLTSGFREATGRADAPVLIDQEGGRVQRMGPPEWRKYPPARAFSQLYDKDPLAGLTAARLITRLLAHDLYECGISVDCLPVLDVPQPGSHKIIGDRAYGEHPEKVVALAHAATSGLMDGGVLPVIKHIPGHGRATADSHFKLPVVKAPLEELEATDFLPFAALSGLPMAMTAHVVYEVLDKHTPATLSKAVMAEVIRGRFAYDGLVMTDDLTMRALDGTLASRIAKALAAGCDMMLHCNGEMDQAQTVAAASGTLSGDAKRRAGAALKSARMPGAFDEDRAIAILRELVPESR